MSIDLTCQGCGALLDCPDLPDSELYTLENLGLPPVLNCPPGYTCGQGDSIIFQCCDRQLTAVFPHGTTPQQRQVIVNNVLQQCKILQASCGGAPTQLYYNTPQTCTVTCPDGTPFSYTTPAGTTAAIDQATANAVAHAEACAVAKASKKCPKKPPPATCPVFSGKVFTNTAFNWYNPRFVPSKNRVYIGDNNNNLAVVNFTGITPVVDTTYANIISGAGDSVFYYQPDNLILSITVTGGGQDVVSLFILDLNTNTVTTVPLGILDPDHLLVDYYCNFCATSVAHRVFLFAGKGNFGTNGGFIIDTQAKTVVTSVDLTSTQVSGPCCFSTITDQIAILGDAITFNTLKLLNKATLAVENTYALGVKVSDLYGFQYISSTNRIWSSLQKTYVINPQTGLIEHTISSPLIATQAITVYNPTRDWYIAPSIVGNNILVWNVHDFSLKCTVTTGSLDTPLDLTSDMLSGTEYVYVQTLQGSPSKLWQLTD